MRSELLKSYADFKLLFSFGKDRKIVQAVEIEDTKGFNCKQIAQFILNHWFPFRSSKYKTNHEVKNIVHCIESVYSELFIIFPNVESSNAE